MKRFGKLIVLEGIEGAGKSSYIKYISNILIRNKIHFYKTREPGGTVISEDIRNILLKKYKEPLIPISELFLIFASRSQHLNNFIKPKIKEGSWVLIDRYIDSTYAYQGANGIKEDWINILMKWTIDQFYPDLVILFDASEKILLKRIKSRKKLDRIEQRKLIFFKKVRKIYLNRALSNPKIYKIINAINSLKKINFKVDKIIKNFIKLNFKK